MAQGTAAAAGDGDRYGSELTGDELLWREVDAMLMVLLASAVVGVSALQQGDTVIAVREGARVSVHALAATVTVRSWNRSEVRVAVEPARRNDVRVRGGGTMVQIEAHNALQMDDPVEIEITVPAAIDLDVDGAFVEADIEGVRGDVRVNTVNGGVRLVGGDGLIYLHSVQGDVECRDARGRLQLSSANGMLRLANITGEIAAEAVNGTMTLVGIQSSAIEATTVNGEIVYEGTITDRGRYVFGTHNGDLTLTIPAGTNADVVVSTYSGELESEFPVTLTQTRSRGERFGFTLGSGGARIELRSFGGTIRLRRP